MTGVRCEKVYRYRHDDPSLFESDFPRETRVITDLYLQDDTPSTGHKVLFFDIEVSMVNGLPDIQNPNNEITAITGYDSSTNEYSVFILDKNGLYKPHTMNGDRHILPFATEAELLRAFVCEYWVDMAPTIVTGWNSDKFDIPYLYHRLQQLFGQEIACQLSPIGLIKYSPFRGKYAIAGVTSLDYLDLYKKFTYTQQPSYRLDAIGQEELGEGKVEFVGTLDTLFATDLPKFIEYNVRDVKIVVELEEKLKLIELVRGICHVGHVQYEDYCYSSKFLEGTIITYLHRKNIISTNKPPGGRELMHARMADGKERFAGAYVKEPIPGRYDWVYNLDLTSLYPSVIMSLNISPETKRGKVIDWDLHRYLAGESRNYLVRLIDEDQNSDMQTYTNEQFVQFLDQSEYTISSNGILYSSKERGIIPEVLEKWFAERIEYRQLAEKYFTDGDTTMAEFYDRRQHIQKIFLNSLYGVLGLPIFRFYDLDNALSVTASGQDVIRDSATIINNVYQNRLKTESDYCIYVDTDSLYFSSTPLFTDSVQTDEEKKLFSIKAANTCEKILNTHYDDMAYRFFRCTKHALHIKGEAVSRSALWITKKRYALNKCYDLEKNVDIDKFSPKGLDIVRSSFPPLFREFMTGITKAILNGETHDDIDSRLLSFVSDLSTKSYTQISRNTSIKDIRKYDTRGLGFNEFGKGTPSHVKAALSYNKLMEHWNLNTQYAPIVNGDKIRYVYLKPNPFKLVELALKGYDDPPEIMEFVNTYLDHAALFNRELKDKLEDYYKAMRWGSLPTDQNQLSTEFFSF